MALKLLLIGQMNRVLLCTHDPMLLKVLYGPLRDDGYAVEVTDHPAEAVRCVLNDRYSAVMLDSDGIGLNAQDAAVIIQAISPDIHILIIGQSEAGGGYAFERPVAIDRLRDLLREINEGGGHDAKRDRSRSL
jgi:DNA-binding NtrC family response regulator